MRITSPVRHMVYAFGRGQVRVLELLREAGLDLRNVGIPRYAASREDRRVVCVCGWRGSPYTEFVLRMELTATGTRPRLESRTVIPYVWANGPLYEYEPGCLSQWSPLFVAKPPAILRQRFPLIFEVLGPAEGGRGLQAKLPYRSEVWTLVSGHPYAARRPGQLELRLRELADPGSAEVARLHHAEAARLVDLGLREKWVYHDGPLTAVLPLDVWERVRLELDLSADEAVAALVSAVITDPEPYEDGILFDRPVRRYCRGEWSPTAPEDFLADMTDIWDFERRLVRASMKAAGRTRTLYARAVFDRLTRGAADWPET